MENDNLNDNPQNNRQPEKTPLYERNHLYESVSHNRPDTEYEKKRGRRAFGSVWNVIWSLVFIIFFNFYSKYIAYFQYERINGSLHWNVFPIITPDFSKLIPLITAGLFVILVGNIILLVIDRYVLSRIVEILSSVFAVVILINIIMAFPFDFNVIPYNQLSEMLPLIIKILSGLIVLILVILIIANFIKIIIKITKR